MRQERIKVVSVLDPAIDRDSMTEDDIAEYASKRDIAKVRFKPGALPTVYNIREVPHTLWEGYVTAGVNDADRARRCFQCGVEKVENLYMRDGTTLPSYEPTWIQGTKEKVMADESLVRFSPAEREEIGTVIWFHSFLAPRIDPSYRLPPSCRAILISLNFRPVGASQNSPAPNSDKASSPEGSAPQQPIETSSETEKSADNSANPTAAIAVETPTKAA